MPSDRVTIAQVAEEAGVSAMTVSNVVNQRPGASEATRQRVLEVVERLGYTPNASARNLKAGRTGLVGVLSLDLTVQYSLEIVRGIADELADDERELLVNASIDAIREGERIRFFARNLVDGILLIAPALEAKTLKEIADAHVPIVVIDPRQADTPLPRVTVENYDGMRIGAQHLIDLGHERIGFIKGDPDLESSELRFRGFADAMRLAGHDIDPDLVRTTNFTYAGGFKAAGEILDTGAPTAIIGGADNIALGAVDAARSRGLTVPTDLSILGFDDIPRAAQSYPALTTVRQPLHDMGQVGARALVALIEDQPLLTERIRLATELVIRETTAPPRDSTVSS